MDEAHAFMRDNTSGGLVVRMNLRGDGKIRYHMEEGHSYLMSDDDIETLSRFGFKPRLSPKLEADLAERGVVTRAPTKEAPTDGPA